MGASDSTILRSHFDEIRDIESESQNCRVYSVQRAHTKGSDRKRVLLFSGDKHIMQNLKYFSRTVRHPNLLYYIDTFTIESSLTTYVVFESAGVLIDFLPKIKSQEFIHGMRNILSALSFIHDKCLCSFNNVLMSSIFVASNGEWKLGCLENMSKFTNTSWHVYAQSKLPSHLLPPEDTEETTVPASYGYNRDVYMLGYLFRSLLKNLPAASIDVCLSSFRDYIGAHMLNQDYKLRPKCNQIMKHDVFNNYYSLVITFFNNFLGKSPEEKTEFLRSLHENYLQLNEQLIIDRVLPFLLSDHVICERYAQKLASDIWNPSISIKNPKSTRAFLSEAMYRDRVVPLFLKLLNNKGVDSRLMFLSNIKHVLPYIPKQDLSKSVLTRILQGLRDTDDEVVALTFHCLGDLVPYLGSSRVVGGSRKKVFAETRPREPLSALHSPMNIESSYFAEEDEDSRTLEITRGERPSHSKLRAIPDSTNRCSKPHSLSPVPESLPKSYESPPRPSGKVTHDDISSNKNVHPQYLTSLAKAEASRVASLSADEETSRITSGVVAISHDSPAVPRKYATSPPPTRTVSDAESDTESSAPKSTNSDLHRRREALPEQCSSPLDESPSELLPGEEEPGNGWDDEGWDEFDDDIL